MDNITHVVLGAAIGEAVAGRRLGKKAMLWGAISGNIPDIDVFFAPFQSVPDSLLSHRGFTHSILFCVITTFLFSWLMQRWKRSGSDDFKLWMVVFSTGLFSHILIDGCNAYGTGWYEPFSHHRVSFNVLFVVDPFYTIPMLVSCIALLSLRRATVSRKWWNGFGLGISATYIVLSSFNKINTDKVVEQSLLNSKIESRDYVTTPTPFNSLLWYALVKDSTGFYIGYHSIFDKSDRLNFHFIEQHENLLAPYQGDAGVDKLIRFSEGYYCLSSGDSMHVDFHDMRFGQLGGWSDPSAPFVFAYHLGHGENNTMVIQRGRINIANRNALVALIERIKGN